MSKPKSFPNKRINDPISVEDVILEYVLDNRWKDYKKFAEKLTNLIIQQQPTTKAALKKAISRFNHPFFAFNEISREEFVDNFPIEELSECAKTERPFEIKQVQETKQKHSNRKALSKRIRILILERDGYKCCLCGRTAKETKLEVDHKEPVAKGGSDSLNNLWTLCIDCNRGKSDLLLKT